MAARNTWQTGFNQRRRARSERTMDGADVGACVITGRCQKSIWSWPTPPEFRGRVARGAAAARFTSCAARTDIRSTIDQGRSCVGLRRQRKPWIFRANASQLNISVVPGRRCRNWKTSRFVSNCMKSWIEFKMVRELHGRGRRCPEKGIGPEKIKARRSEPAWGVTSPSRWARARALS